MDYSHHVTERLTLRAVAPSDAKMVHELSADPRVWEHFPSGRHTSLRMTEELVETLARDWETHGLGQWAVFSRASGEFLGYAGCSIRRGSFWNLGYRFRPEAQGQGFATEAAQAAVDAAHDVDNSLPVVAYLLDHNIRSRELAERIGLTRQWGGPDVGNPDPDAVRLVYADRKVGPAVLPRAHE